MFGNLAFIVLLLVLTEGRKELHTSQVELKQLYEIQKEHFNIFNDYLNLETKRLDELKKNVDAIQELCKQNSTMNKTNTHNHINVIKVMLQLQDHLFKVDDLISNKQSLETLLKINNYKEVQEMDIILAVNALRSLQKFYEIPSSDLAAGKFKNRTIGDPLDACECLVISKILCNTKDLYGVYSWAIETDKKWKNDSQPKCDVIYNLNNTDISSLFFTVQNIKFFFSSNGLQHILPSSKQYDEILKYNLLMENELYKSNQTMDLFQLKFYDKFKPKYYLKFKKLCQNGFYFQTINKNLKCRYQTKNSNYRILMPFKEEDVSSIPYLKIYHNVLYEGEILKIKSMAMKFMADSVGKNISTSDEENDRRVISGQYYWIDEDYAKEHFDSLNKRIECFTEFSTKTAEEYQIINYGLGGPNYNPHQDGHPKQKMSKKYGNRFLTVLFYMTDIENDGFTAFPSLDFNSPVKKGSALVSHNFHMSNGSYNWDTIHGSCPLLKGNKWIMTRWLCEEGQNLPYNWKNNIET